MMTCVLSVGVTEGGTSLTMKTSALTGCKEKPQHLRAGRKPSKNKGWSPVGSMRVAAHGARVWIPDAPFSPGKDQDMTASASPSTSQKRVLPTPGLIEILMSNIYSPNFIMTKGSQPERKFPLSPPIRSISLAHLTWLSYSS